MKILHSADQTKITCSTSVRYIEKCCCAPSSILTLEARCSGPGGYNVTHSCHSQSTRFGGIATTKSGMRIRNAGTQGALQLTQHERPRCTCSKVLVTEEKMISTHNNPCDMLSGWLELLLHQQTCSTTTDATWGYTLFKSVPYPAHKWVLESHMLIQSYFHTTFILTALSTVVVQIQSILQTPALSAILSLMANIDIRWCFLDMLSDENPKLLRCVPYQYLTLPRVLRTTG